MMRQFWRFAVAMAVIVPMVDHVGAEEVSMPPLAAGDGIVVDPVLTETPKSATEPPSVPEPKSTVDSTEQSARADAARERDQVWAEVRDALLPVQPHEIQAYRQETIEQDRASAPRVAPQAAMSRAIPVSLQPGARSPRLELLHGFVMAIEVLDSTGQPWPVVEARSGDESAFDVRTVGATANSSGAVSSNPDGVPIDQGVTGVEDRSHRTPANVVTITAKRRFVVSNLLLMLQGESRPVSVVLTTAEASESSALGDRITLLVAGNGPLAEMPITPSYDRIDVGDDLRRVLVGQAPVPEATEILGVLPDGMRAWHAKDVLWLRTPHRVISPAPDAVTGVGSMRAFRMRYLPQVVLLDDGRLMSVSVRANSDVEHIGGAP